MPSYQTIYRKIKVGAIVRLRLELQTKGGTILAKELKMKVTGKHGGLELETIGDRPCESCGVGQITRIRKVSALDVIVENE